MLANYLIPLLFVLAFIMPGNIYYWTKLRKKKATCATEEKELKWTKRVIFGSNIAGLVVYLLVILVNLGLVF